MTPRPLRRPGRAVPATGQQRRRSGGAPRPVSPGRHDARVGPPRPCSRRTRGSPRCPAPPAAGAASGLPSRRPGAALAGNPLGAQRRDQPTRPRSGADQSSPSTAPDPRAPQTARRPPRRSASPRRGPRAPSGAGPDTARPAATTARCRASPTRRPGIDPPRPDALLHQAHRRSPQQGVTFEPRAAPVTSAEACNRRDARACRRPFPVTDRVPGRCPSVRPGQPGGGPAIGPSAAIAVAAAAAARPRPLPRPLRGLFAATGPSLETGAGAPASATPVMDPSRIDKDAGAGRPRTEASPADPAPPARSPGPALGTPPQPRPANRRSAQRPRTPEPTERRAEAATSPSRLEARESRRDGALPAGRPGRTDDRHRPAPDRTVPTPRSSTRSRSGSPTTAPPWPTAPANRPR